MLNKLENNAEIVEETYKSGGNGIALENVYKRLKIYYKGKASMHIESKLMRGTSVRITIPLKNNSA